MKDGRVGGALLIASLALLSLVYFGGIGGYPLQDPDEGRYAEIPREMIESGDWVTPRLNYVKYFEKPPLLYWLVALSFESFGTTEGAARLVVALSGFIVVVLSYFLGARLFGRRAGLLGAGVLATSPMYWALSQALTTDPVLTLCFTVTMVSFYFAHASERKTGWAVLAALSAALGVLAKGLIGLVLPGLAGVIYLALARDLPTARALLRPLPIGVFLATVVPWFVLVSRANPEFLEFFFIHEHLGRYTAEVGHPEGPAYYLPVLLAGPLPWTAVAIGLAFSRQARRAFGSLPREGRVLLLTWALTVIVFFWMATTKLAPYMLPAFPPLALLAGAWIDRVLEERPGMILVRSLGLGLLGLGGLFAIVAAFAWLLEGPIARMLSEDPHDVGMIVAAAASGGLVMLISGLIATRALDRGHVGAFAALSILIGGFALSMLAIVPARGVVKTSRELAQVVEKDLAPGDLLVSYHKFMHGLVFYTQSRVTLVKNYDEIKHGGGWASDRAEFFWDKNERLRDEWSSGRRVFLTTDVNKIPELNELLSPPPRVLTRDRRRVLMVNFDSAEETEAAAEPGAEPAPEAPPAGSEAQEHTRGQG